MTKERKRLLLLALMLVILFFNWYHYHTVDFFFREGINSGITAIEDHFPSVTFLSKFNMMAKGISMFLLTVINISISLTIIYLYFLEWKLVRQALKLLVTFATVCFVLVVYTYYNGSQAFLDSILFALKQLSTPLVECSLIPLLKLMNAEVPATEE